MSGLVVAAGQTHEIAAGATLDLDANTIVEGTLVLRASQDHTAPTRLRFVNVNEADFVGTVDSPVPSDVGLWIVGAGRVIVDAPPITGWLSACESLVVGQEWLPLDRVPIGWQVGGEIEIAPTAAWTGTNPLATRERRTILGFDGARVKVAPLSFAHPAIVDGARIFTAEVSYLSRGVWIEGTPQGRSHWLTKSTARQQLSGIGIRHMGVPGKTGRYPLHLHHVGQAMAGVSVEGVLVRDSGHHAIVTHAAHGITVRDCVAIDTQESPWWWDIGHASDDVVLDRCLAAGVYHPTTRRVAGFVLGSGKRNACRDCHVYGVVPTKTLYSAGIHWPEMTTTLIGAWDVSDTVVHHGTDHGLFVWQNTADTDHRVHGLTAYRLGGYAVSHGAYRNSYSFRDVLATECKGFALINGGAKLLADGRGQRWTGGRGGAVLTLIGGAPVGIPADLPIRILRHEVASIVVDAPLNEAPMIADVIECGTPSVQWVKAPAGSVLRVQYEDGTAVQYAGAQAQPIPRFWP